MVSSVAASRLPRFASAAASALMSTIAMRAHVVLLEYLGELI